jgi:hypothetical protein
VQLPARTIAVKAVVQNPRRELQAGMFAEVRLETGRRPNATVVPEDAIIPSQGGNVVWLVDGDKVSRRAVTLGVRTPGFVEVQGVTGQLADLVPRPTGTAPAGLYQDGLSTYDRGLIGDGINDPGNFNIQAACLRGRSFDLVLPTQWQGLLPAAPLIASCSGPPSGPATFVQLHFPGLAVADCPDGSTCPMGGPHDPADGSNYADDIFYYFTVDSDGDGRWGPPKDDAYNVIWSDARFSVLRRALDGTPCQWHILGGTANLWQRQATPLDTNRGVVLDVIVTRTDGVCA